MSSAPAPVSIIMPAYNRVKLIARSLASLQREPGIDADIIVVDDGSADGTDRLVESLAAEDPRIRLIRQYHQGVSAARNAGVRAVRHDYVTFLDSDDISAPGRIARQVRKLAARPDITAVIGHRMLFSAMTEDFQPRENALWEKKLDICLGSGMFRRSVFDTFGLFDEKITFGEDIDFYFRLFEADALLIIEPDIAVYHRRHSGNMTNDRSAVNVAILRAFHNSMQRRRESGRTQRLDVFFFQKFEQETLFGGGRREVLSGQAVTCDAGS